MIRLKALTPKQPFDRAALRRAIARALDDTAEAVKRDYAKTAATWRNPPAFAITAPRENERVIGTDDEKYGWADDGTKPHDIGPIVAVNKKAITIRGKGTPKTAPRVIGSSSGSRGPVIAIRKRTKVIRHPGTEAREFSETIGAQADEELAKRLQAELNRVE